MTRWAFITTAGPEVGLGHAARVATLASEAMSSGDQVAVFLPEETEPPLPLQLAGVPTENALFTYQDLGQRLRSLPDDTILLMDLPDPEMASLTWLRSARNFRVAFRMFGPPKEDAFENVSLTPEFESPRELFQHQEVLPNAVISGRDLIIVRPTLFAAAEEKSHDSPLIVVTMGGADPLGLTEIACAELMAEAIHARVVVVVGSSNDRGTEISRRYGHKLEVVSQADVEFDPLLRSASIAVINGGLTRYECIAALTPFIAISVHQTQFRITEKVTRHGFGHNLGVYTELAKGSVSEAATRMLVSPQLGFANALTEAQWISPHASARLLQRCREWRRSGFP